MAIKVGSNFYLKLVCNIIFANKLIVVESLIHPLQHNPKIALNCVMLVFFYFSIFLTQFLLLNAVLLVRYLYTSQYTRLKIECQCLLIVLSARLFCTARL